MTQVGIFGDQLVPQGPEAAEEVVNEAIAAAGEEVEVEEVEVEETEETPSDFPEGFTTTVIDPATDQAIEVAEADAEQEEAEDDDDEETDEEEDDDKPQDEGETPKTAGELVEEIEAAETVEEVDALADGVEFKTVIAAAAKRKEELAS